jgi:hypothetical protein
VVRVVVIHQLVLLEEILVFGLLHRLAVVVVVTGLRLV